MADQGDDDSFLEDFLARAKERQARLAKINKRIEAHTKEEVSYPPLSPLEEEDASSTEDTRDLKNKKGKCDHDDDDVSYDIENTRNESVPDELNYSSDLSIECNAEESELHRARPVYVDSSPEQPTSSQNNNSQPFSQISPRKRAQPNPHNQQLPQNPHYIQTQQQQLNNNLPPQSNQPEPLHERQQEQKATSSQSLPEMSSTEQSIKALQQKVERAEQTRTQLKKAVEVSKHGSKEHIVAARLLQIAEIEHLNYTNYMAMYKQGMRKKTESLGSITISSIRLKISSKLRNDLAEDGVSHYFFCVASCGTEVKATNIMNTNDIRKQDSKSHIQFRDNITFADLPPDFVVKVEIFELVISQPLPKLLLRLTPSKKTKITLETNFKRVGSLKLTLSDREICYKSLVQWSKHEESKYLERECKFEMHLKPEQLPTKTGMLHVRCLDGEGRPDWTRYWVDLSQGLIRMWYSQQDALDDKKPNQIYEFQDLCSEKVQKLTPNDNFYRQFSFVLYSQEQVTGGEKDTLFQRVLKEDPKFKIVKHQLAAENKEDRDSWCAILDRSMNCFREWHGKSKLYSIEELKEMFLTSY